MIGQTISHCRIVEKLGGGGIGVVYKAEDTRLHRFVALKFLPDEVAKDAQTLTRFRREAQAVSALNHPNIVMLHDISSEAGADFLVMEYVQGQTLENLIASDGLPFDRVTEYGVQIASALAAAHSAGIVHRDIKPANIMITQDNQIKVLDFGVAKLTRSAAPVQTLKRARRFKARSLAWSSAQLRTCHRSRLAENLLMRAPTFFLLVAFSIRRRPESVRSVGQALWLSCMRSPLCCLLRPAAFVLNCPALSTP